MLPFVPPARCSVTPARSFPLAFCHAEIRRSLRASPCPVLTDRSDEAAVRSVLAVGSAAAPGVAKRRRRSAPMHGDAEHGAAGAGRERERRGGRRCRAQAASSCSRAASRRRCRRLCRQRRKRRRARATCQPTSTPAAKAASSAQRTTRGQVVRRLWALQPEWHLLPGAAQHPQAERHPLALLPGAQLLAEGHPHADTAHGLLAIRSGAGGGRSPCRAFPPYFPLALVSLRSRR